MAEEEVFCRAVSPASRVQLKMRECSAYDDRSIPNLYSMKKIAWELQTKSAGRSIGFVTSEKFREIEGDDAEVIPATATTKRAKPRAVGGETNTLTVPSKFSLTFAFYSPIVGPVEETGNGWLRFHCRTGSHEPDATR